MKFIIGYKSRMSQVHRPDGRVVPVTIVKAPAIVVTQLRQAKPDGYLAVQVGSGKAKRANKAMRGHVKETGPFKVIREFRPRKGQTLPEMNVGQELTVGQFEVGDVVHVIGTSKGRGFQGVVKRHGFHGSPKTHGHKDQLRMPGSIGSTAPQHVFRGTRMGGHMGDAQVTVKNLEIVNVDPETNEIMVMGAVPGAPRSLLLIQTV